MANVFKGTGATDQEIKAWRSNLSNAMSPQQIDGAIRQLVALMGGRLDALQEQFRTGMGKPMDFAILTPKSKELLKKLGGDEQQQSEQGSPVYVNGQIVGYTTDGKTMTKVGGQ